MIAGTIDGTARVQSKYTFAASDDGFRVEGRDRTPVRVALMDTHFVVESHLANGEPTENVGLVEFSGLVASIAKRLMDRWELPRDRPEPRWTGMANWAVQQTQRAIGKRTHWPAVRCD